MSEKQIIIFWSEQTSCNLGMLQVNPPLPSLLTSLMVSDLKSPEEQSGWILKLQNVF